MGSGSIVGVVKSNLDDCAEISCGACGGVVSEQANRKEIVKSRR
jgi:hypothetical protein